jgi:hypothetical protein
MAAQRTHPHDADDALARVHRRQPAPGAVALVLLQNVELAMEAQHMQQYIFRHADRQPAIDNARQRHMLRDIRISQDAVNPGAKAMDQFEIEKALQQTRRRLPDQRDVDVSRISGFRIDADIEIGSERLNGLGPIGHRVAR